MLFDWVNVALCLRMEARGIVVDGRDLSVVGLGGDGEEEDGGDGSSSLRPWTSP